MDYQQLMQEVTVWIERKSRQLGDTNAQVKPDTDLLETGLLDSLGVIELIAFIEDSAGQMVNMFEIDLEQFTPHGLCQAAREGKAA